MKKITIQDLSKATGFSKSTVSKAINNSKEISKKTKKKINNYAKKLNYRPNYFASNLRKNSIKNIAIVVPSILNYYFAKVIKGAQNTLFKSGYNLICFFNDESISKEKKILNNLQNGSVAGIIISCAKNSNTKKLIKELDKLKKFNTPTVMFDRVIDNYDSDKVSMDNHEATYECVKHLTKKGKKKIALISPIHETTIGQDRFRGYKDALKSENLKFDEDLYIRLSRDEDKIIESEISKLCLSNKIDSIICIEQITTVAIHRLVQKLGKNIPDEISIIGFTDGPLFKYTNPSITSLDQHGEYFGKLSAKLIVQRIEGKIGEKFIHEKIPCSIVERNST